MSVEKPVDEVERSLQAGLEVCLGGQMEEMLPVHCCLLSVSGLSKPGLVALTSRGLSGHSS